MTTTLRHPPFINRRLILTLIALSLLLFGCSRVSQETETNQEAESRGVQIELIEPLFPPATGPSTLEIRLFDADANNKPINNAKIHVKGDMTHAGMIPVLGETENGADGVYKVPLEWTMGGDWVVQVQATLPDGTRVEKTFPMTITYDPGCANEDKNRP